MKVYISGSITKDGNYYYKFEKAEKVLRLKGFEVVNPTKLPHNHNKEWEAYMVESLKAMLDCDSIYMIKGWTESKGALIEFQLATSLGFNIHFEN